MQFQGQTRIIRELQGLLPRIEPGGENHNIGLFAPSGMGKTHLALNILFSLGPNNSHVSQPENDFYFDKGRRFHFIDEVHLVKDPERFYSLMDSKRYTIIIATNEAGDIKEPMYNRCIPLIFEPYSLLELAEMGKNQLGKYVLNDELIFYIADKFRVPRVLKQTIERLKSVFPYFIPQNIYEMDRILEEILSINRDGFNPYERLYVDTLKNLGGHASINLITNATRMGRNTILRDVEPGLIYRGIIRIGSKGRELV